METGDNFSSNGDITAYSTLMEMTLQMEGNGAGERRMAEAKGTTRQVYYLPRECTSLLLQEGQIKRLYFVPYFKTRASDGPQECEGSMGGWKKREDVKQGERVGEFS